MTKNKHFLTGEELSRDDLRALLDLAETLKGERQENKLRTTMAGKNLTLLFEKQSLRTRVSFTVAMQELGGNVVELQSSNRKKEEPEDTVGVLEGYTHGLMVRTFDHQGLERMAKIAKIPIINGLSDTHHPCQALADLLTLKQKWGSFENLKVAYLGDGNNVLHSLLLLLPFLGVHFYYSCPTGYEPNSFIVKKARARAKAGGGSITACADPKRAVSEALAVYTDVWTSMGFETQEAQREKIFEPYQLNEELYKHADSKALVMHCMPMVRGKEISEAMASHKNCVIFAQSENRLHAQKALLLGCL